MKLALLGTDPDAVALLAAAINEGHQLAWLGDVRAQDEQAVRALTSLRAARPTEWEMLLDHATVDAIIVGRGAASEELRTEQLKRFVADAVPLLVVHPAGPNLLTYYELDMVRRETGAILRHYNPLVGHPQLTEIAHWVIEGYETIGNVVQITMTRHVASGAREVVLDGLARDVELLADVAGDIRQVSAIGPRETPGVTPTGATGSANAPSPGATGSASAPSSYASLQVQMTSTVPATLRWSVVPTTAGSEKTELTLIGEHGTLSIEPATLPPFDAPLTAIRQLAAAVEQGKSGATQDTLSNLSTWDEPTKAMEVVDAIELSLQKGRTIEVFQQQLTEQLAFRGTMAALGCGLLLLGLVAVIIVGIAAIFEAPLQQPILRGWPIILLAVLAFFLLLQFVPWLSAKQKARRKIADGDNDDSNA